MSFDPAARPRFVPGFARGIFSIFFRRVELLGLSHVPEGGPVVFVANHPNGLVDPGLLVAFLPRPPRFLAKSTLWGNPVVRPFLDLAAAIPVYRRQDPGVDASRNEETFRACRDVLAAGGAIAIFPEGVSHSESALLPLKTGVGRIVLDALDRGPDLPVRIVPVGLTYDDKGTFRSRVLLDVGAPIDPRPWLEAWREDPRETVRQLTDRIHAALEDVTLNYPSWKEAGWIQRAAEVWSRPEVDLPSAPDMAAHYELRQRFADAYLDLRGRLPDLVAGVAARVEAYDEELERWRLDDAQVAALYPWTGVLRFVRVSLWRLLVLLPLGVLGIALHWPAWTAIGALSRRSATSPDVESTYKVFGSLLLYPVTWLLVAAGVGLRFGTLAALGAAVACPVLARVGLALWERRLQIRRQARAFLLLRSRRKAFEPLREQRRRLRSAVGDLVAIWSTGLPPVGSTDGVDGADSAVRVSRPSRSGAPAAGSADPSGP